MKTKKKTAKKPNPNTHPMVGGETRSWEELDKILQQKFGTSLADRIEALGRPKKGAA